MFMNMTRQTSTLVVTAVAGICALCSLTHASAESPDGWRQTGPETTVFVAKRDDGRTVGVFARPATKDRVEGTLVRVTLAGFKDKSVALRKRDVPELFTDYHSWFVLLTLINVNLTNPFDRIWAEISKQSDDLAYVRKVFYHAGQLEMQISIGIHDGLGGRREVSSFRGRARSVVLASEAGGDVTKRFVAANGATVRNVPEECQGAVVRAIHAALIGSGAK